MSKDKTPETKSKTLNPEVLAVAKIFYDGLTTDKKTGAGEEKEKDLFERTLPEDLPLEMYNRSSAHRATVLAAGTYAFGQHFTEAMEANPKLQTCSGVIKMGDKESMGVSMERSQDYVNHLSGNGEKTTKYGVVRTEYMFKGASKNSGQMKIARNLLAEAATAKFKK